ncbi:MAG: glycosyltransferase [Sedimentisphaerales bacterium]|nr:glycosyltransferase [Sedimentisphaerales bacterium]
MRIAFVVDVFPAFSDTCILNQITDLMDRGHEIDIFAQVPGAGDKHHAAIQRYHLLDRCHYRIAMPGNPILRMIKAMGLFLVRGHRNHALLWESLKEKKYGRPASSLRLFYEAVSRLDAGAYDIIHCHFGPNGLLWSCLRRLGVVQGKLITSFHGWDVNILPRLLGDDYLYRLFQDADLYTVSSDFIRQRILSLGALPEKIIKLPVGINPQKFAFKPRALNGDHAITLLTVGRLSEVKGIEYSLRAVARLTARYPHIRYLIAGDGPLRKDLENLARDLGISTRVRFLGDQTEEELVHLYDQAHIFVLAGIIASDGDEEGQGMVLLEAQAAGLPVIASRVGGIPESIQPGQSGILVEPKDIDGLAYKLGFLIENPHRWPAMGQAGRRHVETWFDIHKLNNELVELYENLLDNKPAHENLKYDTIESLACLRQA